MRKNIVVFGEVLFDCFEDGTEILGGAPFNVAWHLQAFGLKPILISRIGNDDRGKKIKDAMHRWGMNLDYLQIDPARPTGTVSISVTNGEPSYSISPDHAWGHIQPISSELPENTLIYHGTLALWSQEAREALALLKSQGDSSCFVDVNLRDPWWKRDMVLSIIRDALYLKLNEDELHSLFPNSVNETEAINWFLNKWGIKAIILTRGEEGASFYRFQKAQLNLKKPQVSKIVDTVGAGDAFSAVFILGIVKGWEADTTLERAQDFASAIIMSPGATVEDESFYKSYLRKWSSP